MQLIISGIDGHTHFYLFFEQKCVFSPSALTSIILLLSHQDVHSTHKNLHTCSLGIRRPESCRVVRQTEACRHISVVNKR